MSKLRHIDECDPLNSKAVERSGGPKVEVGNPNRSPRFVIVENRRLWRDCLIRCLELSHPDAQFVAFDTVGECVRKPESWSGIDAVFLCVGPGQSSVDEMRELVSVVAPIPVAVLSDTEDMTQFATVRKCGVKGWVSTNLELDTIFSAMKMAATGGFVMTPDGIDAMQQTIPKAPQTARDACGSLTIRQSAVAEALRQGKPNKIIAYELGLCENTVKVHVRSILTKLNASNRTEAAFKLNEQAAQGQRV